MRELELYAGFVTLIYANIFSPGGYSMTSQQRVAERIREHLKLVSHLRTETQNAGLSAAVQEVKRLQARRFRATYREFFVNPRYAGACRFFLDELYGEHDFNERDEQFGRIAGAIDRMFPEDVGSLAVDLAETHALTESLDQQMATHWMAKEPGQGSVEKYISSWRLTGEREKRFRQLAVVEHMGSELQKLTGMKSLLFSLRLMRKPAQLAGLTALQQFLERGFSAFAQMGDASLFLSTISRRERQWIDALFDDDFEVCSEKLTRELSEV